MRREALAVTITLLATSPALAHHYRPIHVRHYHHAHFASRHRHFALSTSETSLPSGVPSARPSDCYGIPWCGCFMRHVEGVSSKAYNLARQWAHWGVATVAQIGAVVVWPHHVGKIVAGAPGRWVVLSGNDGHRVRERVRSVAGAIAFRRPG